MVFENSTYTQISLIFLLLLLSVSQINAQQYIIEDSYQASNFFDNILFFTNNDPSGGFVDYIGIDEAKSLNMSRIINNKIYLGSENNSIVQPGKRGRKSIRAYSKKMYKGGLFIFDIDHMPSGKFPLFLSFIYNNSGCGTWPAFWFDGVKWPDSGEIDVIEGINLRNYNQITLHTTDGCNMDAVNPSSFSGKWSERTDGKPCTNCYIHSPYQGTNQGCGVKDYVGSFGIPFNQIGGGVIALQWNFGQFMKMWVFRRNNVPIDIKNDKPNPQLWGLPDSNFLFGSNCTPDHFSDLRFIINNDFCGSWVSSDFTKSCPNKGTCNDFVANNPSQFDQAYWLINYLKVYQEKTDKKINEEIFID